MSAGSFWGKSSFWKKSLILTSSKPAKIFCLWQKLITKAAKTVLYGPEQLFKGKYFFKEMQFSSIFWILGEEVSNYWRKFFNMVLKTAFYVSRGRLWLINFFLEIFLSFFSKLGTKQNFFGLLTVFFSRFSKTHFNCWGDNLEGEKCCKKIFYSWFFGHLAKKCWLLRPVSWQGTENFFIRVRKSTFRKFLERIVFFLYYSDIERKHFGLFSKFS